MAGAKRGANGQFIKGPGAGPLRVRVQIKDVDKGYQDLVKRINASKTASIEVGIMGDKGASAKKGGPGLTVLDVATFHEFGLGIRNVAKHDQRDSHQGGRHESPGRPMGGRDSKVYSRWD